MARFESHIIFDITGIIPYSAKMLATFVGGGTALAACAELWQVFHYILMKNDDDWMDKFTDIHRISPSTLQYLF